MTTRTTSKHTFAGAAMRNIGVVMLAVLPLFLIVGSTAGAADPPDLGTALSFAVLGGQSVTNTGPTVISGDLGVSPGTAVPGSPPLVMTDGTTHAADAVAVQAQSDLTIAYNDAAGRDCDVSLTGTDLGDRTLTAGTYCFASSAQLTGPVTFDAEGTPSAVFIIQIGSTLTTASASSVNLINGADPCNIFWQVGSSATLGTDTAFQGNILALTSITLDTRATLLDGRALARNGSVTMDTNRITRGSCVAAESTPTPTAAATASASPTASPEPTPTPTPTPTPDATSAPTPTPDATSTPTPTADASTPTPTATASSTPTPTPSATPTTTPTSSPPPTPTPTALPVAVPVLTPSPTPTPTATSTPAAPARTPTSAAAASAFPATTTPTPGPGAVRIPLTGVELPRTGAYIGIYVLLGLALTVSGEIMRRWARAAASRQSSG